MRSYQLSSQKLWKRLVRFAVCTILTLSMWFPAHDGHAAGQEDAEVYRALQEGQRLLSEKSYTEPDAPTVYLTFDDGPSKLTAQVLDILQEEHIQATFFALGEQVEAHPELARRIVEEGHTLGNHSYNHVYKELYSSFASFWEQVTRSGEIMYDTTGVRPQLLRAPGGTYTNFDAYYYYFLDQAGYTIVDWNVDSGDSKRPHVPVEEIISAVKKTPLHRVVNVLFHDGSGHENTVKALPEVIRYYKDQGYSFAPLSSSNKPNQFPLGKLKWKRSLDYAAFLELEATIRQYVQEHAHENRQMQADAPKQPSSAAAADAEESLIRQVQAASEEAGAALALLKSGAFAQGDGGTLKTALEESAADIQIAPDSATALRPAAASDAESSLLRIELGKNGYMLTNEQVRITGQQAEHSLRAFVEQIGGSVSWDSRTRTASAHYGVYDIDYILPAKMIRVSVLGQPQAVYPLAAMRLADDTLMVPLAQTAALFGAAMPARDSLQEHNVVSFDWISPIFWKSTDGFRKNALYAWAG